LIEYIRSGKSDAASFARELDIARNILSDPPGSPLAIGAGYLGWMLNEGGNAVDTLRLALEQRVKSVWFSFGANLGKWVQHVRQYDQRRETPHSTLIWVLVNSVAEAEQATKEWKADVLVVQGRPYP
jgi:nitronate monooxygenase